MPSDRNPCDCGALGLPAGPHEQQCATNREANVPVPQPLRCPPDCRDGWHLHDRRPVRLTQRGHELAWACRTTAALLLSLLLAAAVQNWI